MPATDPLSSTLTARAGAITPAAFARLQKQRPGRQGECRWGGCQPLLSRSVGIGGELQSGQYLQAASLHRSLKYVCNAIAGPVSGCAANDMLHLAISMHPQVLPPSHRTSLGAAAASHSMRRRGLPRSAAVLLVAAATAALACGAAAISPKEDRLAPYLGAVPVGNGDEAEMAQMMIEGFVSISKEVLTGEEDTSMKVRPFSFTNATAVNASSVQAKVGGWGRAGDRGW